MALVLTGLENIRSVFRRPSKLSSQTSAILGSGVKFPRTQRFSLG